MTKPAGPDGPTHTNRLAHESSPYLRQHMHNPVDWWPWCDQAFEKARAEDKPIFLSIGYSTCHWCHVMAHESFEDPAVGELLNRDFISIKLDREERPDLDGIYMTALQQVSGHGGWPMSVMLDHDRRPFFLGTYFPKDDRYGRPGFRTLLARIVEVWRTRRDEILDAAKGIIDAVAKSDTTEPGEVQGEQVLSAAVGQLTRRFDTQNGGFGAKPKFPTPHVFSLLLREARRAGIEEVRDAARHMAHFSLRKLINGGIHDHVGGGFHRYSTDEIWRLPHFEKMLYDQALLATAFIDGYSLTGDPELADAARGIFRYVLRDLRDPSGGFWSAEDADSEGHEGTFYVFTKAQVSDVLGPDDGARVANLFQFSDQGNYADEASGKRDGTNILHLHRDNEPDLDRAKYQQEIWPLLDRLRQWRDQRIRPHLDDKVLASWNGLMLSALARGAGGWVPSPTNATPIGTGERAHPDAAQLVTAALELGHFLLKEMRGPEGLWHNWHRGRASIPGFLDDYAFVAYGLLDLYQLTLEVEWLEASTALAHEMIRLFADRDADGNPLGFFFTREGQADVLVRRKEAYDGAEPSGNSVACDLLLRLGRLLGDAEFLAAGDGVLRAFAGRLSDFASGHCRMAIAISDALANPAEVTVVTATPENGSELLAAARSSGPTTQLIHVHSANRDRLVALSPSLAGMKLPEQTTAAAFVCRGGVCSLPVTGASDLMQALQA